MIKKIIAAASLCIIAACVNKPSVNTEINKDNIKAIADHVWQWQQYQINHNPKSEEYSTWGAYAETNWIYGALMVGAGHWAKATNNHEIYQEMDKLAKRNNYEMGPRYLNADDHTIGQLYLDLANYQQKPEYLENMKRDFDRVLADPPKGEFVLVPHTEPDWLKWPDEYFDGRRYAEEGFGKERWVWADAIFMAPPVLLELSNVTGNNAYADYAHTEFWNAYDALFDKESGLFMRDVRFWTKKGKTGEKIFWSRGNGWVYAGLARMIEDISPSHALYKKYVELYLTMSKALHSLQKDNGYWPASLHEGDLYKSPETSGTAFMVYGLTWGINNGLLDKSEYLPAVKNGWFALTQAVHDDGKLGYVQPIGAAPEFGITYDTTAMFGVGAFLMAASEMYLLVD